MTGRETLFQALKRLRVAPGVAGEMPKPDDPWGAWVEYRLDRLESQQTWLMRLLCGTLAVQVGLKIVEMVK